jgi:uncharacterized SAM-binding protein YcdF (DUF218 family)
LRGRRRFILLGLATVVAICAVAWIARAPILRALGRVLVTDEAPEKVDAIVVLAGGGNGDRILRGAELVQAGYANVAYVSSPHLMYDRSECDLAVPYAESKGFPASLFLCVPMDAKSTREEARAMMEALRRHGVHRALLVTSDFHTARARRVFLKEAPGLEFRMIASRSPDFEIDRWWKSRDGFKAVYTEWSKTIAYLFDF